MTHRELCKLHELKGRLEGRAICLESDVSSTSQLIEDLKTAEYKAHFQGKLDTLCNWSQYNASILADVERIIKEAKNDRK